MRVCSKCGDFYADRLLAFCLADGAPLLDVDPGNDTWHEGVRVVDRKAITQRAQNRKLKWKRAILRAMLMATLVVTAAAFSRSISVTIDRPRGELCIETFNDLNGNGAQDAGEQGVSGLVFQVSGTDAATTLTTDLEGGVCSDLPVGTYSVVEQPQIGWIATPPAMQTVTVTTGQAANVVFGSRQERGKLCIETFNDQNGNGERDAGEQGLSGFVFQVSGTDLDTTLTTPLNGDICAELPVGKYMVVETPMPGWIATTPTTRTVTVTAGQSANVPYGSRQGKGQETGKLCIGIFNDLNGNRAQDALELGLSGFSFRVTGTDLDRMLTTGPRGDICLEVPVGRYTVVQTPKPGWIATTPATRIVTVTATPTANALFGIRQERGRLCISTFDDQNRNQLKDTGEQGLSGFVFQVSGTGFDATLKTGLKGDICSDLPVGKYTVIETPNPGWTATTGTKFDVTLTAEKAVNLSFGNRANQDSMCSDADKSRVLEIIKSQPRKLWGKTITGARAGAENGSADVKSGPAALDKVKFETQFSKGCSTAVVTVTYMLQMPGAAPVRKQQRYECVRTGAEWKCR